MLKNKKGMTLIELLAVIAIIAILFILLVPQISNAFEKARLTGVKTDLNDYRLAAKSYFIESEGEDKTAEGFNKHLAKNLRFTDNKSTETNAWGNPYELVVSDDKKTITIKTQNKEKEPKEYSLAVAVDEKGEIQMDVAGLDGTQKGDSKPPKEVCNITNPTEEKYFTVVDKDGGVSITDYSADGPKDVVIPCQIGGKDVVDISEFAENKGAFRNKSITSVVLPNTLKTISGNYAFSENQLTSVTIPDSVTKIGACAFSFNQLTSLTIPYGVTSMGYAAFSDNQLTSVTIPDSVKIIWFYAFSNNQLTSVTIPSSVTSIAGYAFYTNPNLKTVINKSSISNTTLAKYFDSSPTITN